MKKISILVVLMMVCILVGCTGNSEVDRLQKELDDLRGQLSENSNNANHNSDNDNSDDEQITSSVPTTETIKLGDIIEFGSINWIVLSVENDKMLILSEEVLEQRAFHHENVPVTWEECDIRAYLNSSFYNATFNDQEKKRILDSELENKSNPINVFKLQGGPNTIDKIFLLSTDEVNQYMGDNSHVKLRTARVAKYIVTGEAVNWQLRSHGKGYHKDGCGHYEGSPCHPEQNWYPNAYIIKDGTINNDSVGEGGHPGGIRPAMWIKL